MLSASYTCPACGVPFTSPAMLENHQRRFCLDSRVDREAANIMANLRGGGGGAQYGAANEYPISSPPYMGALMVPPHKPQSGASSAPPRMHYPGFNGGGGGALYGGAGGGALPSVDYELFQLIRTQQQQIALIQGLMNSPYTNHLAGPRISPRQQQFPNGAFGGPLHANNHLNHPQGGPWNDIGAGPHVPPAQAPLASMTGESSLTEGRYGLQFFGVEGLEPLLSCEPEEVSLVVREYVASVEQDQQHPLQRASRDGRGLPASALFLDARGDRTFGPGCVAVSRSRSAQGQYKCKDVEVSFSVLQNRELHVFVVELYAPDGRLLGWTDITVDALGEKARPLRGGLVEAAVALKSPSLRVVPGALIGVETFRTSWKQQVNGSSKPSKRPVSAADSDSDHAQREATPPPRRPSIQKAPSQVVPGVPPARQPAADNNRKGSDNSNKRDASIPLPTNNGDPLSIRSPSGSPNYNATSPPANANNRNSGTFAARAENSGILNTTTLPPPQDDERDDDQTAAVKVGKGPTRDAARLAIDSVTGVPLHASCTRVVLYYASAKLDGDELYPITADDFFLRQADVVTYQTLDSSTTEPAFVTEVNMVVGKATTVVAIVECVDPKKNVRFTLGHAIIPVNQETNAGNYKTRLLWGDPRPSHLRHPGPKTVEEDAQHRAELEKYDTTQLNASLLSRELKEAMKQTVPTVEDRTRFWPGAYIMWRADSNDRKQRYKEPQGQFPLGADEAALLRDRERIPTRTPATYDVKSMDHLLKAFEQKSVPADDAIAYANPYNPNRGIFMAPECLRGMTTERCLYKVMVEMSVEGGEQTSTFTQRHDFESDIGVPEFTDDPFIFAKVPYSLTGVAIFRIFKMLDPSIDRPGGIMPIAWSATKLFLEDGVVRHGRFSVPLFAGSPPPRLIDDLKKERIDQTVMKWTSNPPSGQQKLEYLKPNSIITFCQGDAARSVELVSQRDPFCTDARLLLVPTKVRRQFPFQEDEGYLDEPLSSVVPSGVSHAVFQEEMNKQLRKYFKKL